MKRNRLLIILGVLMAVIAIAAVACDDDDDEDGDGDATPPAGETPQALGSVDVLGIWGDDELVSFEAMVAPWVDTTGGEVDFVGTRDITADLTLRVEGGNPPDVAAPAEIGLFRQFAQNGDLVPLSDCTGLDQTIQDNYPQGFVDLGTVDGTLYGFFMKADTKGTVWYNPTFFSDNTHEALTADASFDDLVGLTDEIRGAGVVPPWSIGVESAEASGWPGTDWIQQIILNEAGEDVYDGVIDGSIPFTDERVQAAWEQFGQIALGEGNVVQEGGATGINATGFEAATFPPFESPPTAALTYLGGFAGGFITTQFPDAVAGTDYDFFPWPGGAVTGGATIVYAFNSDPTTCSFLEWLASAEAQQIWVDRGGFTSVHSGVSLDSYPDAVAQAQAEQLTTAEVFRFDLDDAIGGALQSAYFTGVTQYLTNPDTVADILAGIEAARESDAGDGSDAEDGDGGDE